MIIKELFVAWFHCIDRKFPFNCPCCYTNACTGLFEQTLFILNNELYKSALPFIYFIYQLYDVFRTFNNSVFKSNNVCSVTRVFIKNYY